MKTLHVSTLIRHRACATQVAKFRELFDDSVEVTPELCAKYAEDFDFDWAAQRLLPTPLRKTYNVATAEALSLYFDATADERKTYDATLAGAGKAYDSVCAAAFADAFNSA